LADKSCSTLALTHLNNRDASSKKDLSELNLMMLAALDQSEREIVPSVEAVVLEAVQRLAQDTDKLLNSVQAGDERNAVVITHAMHAVPDSSC
jgi:16S rRNA U1498 N3-methylase RsmE